MPSKDCRAHIADTIPARLACYNKERRIIWINRYSAELLKSDVNEIVGKNCCEVWQNCSQPFMECHLLRALKTGKEQKAEIKTAHGRIWALTAFPKTDENGQLLFISEYGRDITVEKQLKELEDEINAITRHDLKSPALATLNTVRIMQGDANLTPDQRELLEELERSGQHMMEIINHTLTLHKIERGEYEAALRRIDCLSIIRSVRSYYRQQQASAGIRILAGGRHPEDETVCFVDAEENLLRTALMNIVKNALEASPKGREIIIDVLQNAHTTIRVENAGAVPMQVRDNFFEKYSTSGKRGGTGLGTYSAKIMINAQNANIAMHTEGKGDAGKTVVDIIF